MDTEQLISLARHDKNFLQSIKNEKIRQLIKNGAPFEEISYELDKYRQVGKLLEPVIGATKLKIITSNKKKPTTSHHNIYTKNKNITKYKTKTKTRTANLLIT